MKITDPAVIKGGEGELIDAITADMDWGVIGKVFLEKHKLDIDDDVEYKNGDIVVYNNQIAYKLDFDVKVNLSILLDREGSYISLSTDLDSDTAEESGDEKSSAEPDPTGSEEEGGSEEEVSEPDRHESDEDGNLDSGSDDKDSKEKGPEVAAAAEDAIEHTEGKG